MRPLLANDIIRVWERGQGKPYLERAMLLLTAALPDVGRNALADLTIGQRDAILLALREKTLGSALQMYDRCAQCSESLEFTVSTSDIRMMEVSEEKPAERELRHSGYVVRYRLPDSWDLAFVRELGDVVQARSQLLQKCILAARHNGTAIRPEDLPNEVVNALTARMEVDDPQADIQFNVRCPTCGFNWQTIFDIVPYLWTEISVAAQRLLIDVHALARAYGWDQDDILAMSAARRRFYLEIVG